MGFKINNVDVTTGYISKQQLFDIYPSLSNIVVSPKLFSWGLGNSGQIGNNTTTTVNSSPVQTVAGGTNWKQVDCGVSHTAAIKSDGTLWSWGNCTFGELGDNSATSKSSPVQTLSAGTTWKQVSCGQNYSVAIKTDGTLWVWGYNNNGQLGDNTVTTRSSPVQTVSAGSNWKQVSANLNATTSAIKTDGTLWSWGYGANGELGDNTTTSKSSPVQTVSAGTTWKQVANGNSHTAAIKTDGTLWSWGAGSNGALGDNTIVSKSSPVQTVSAGTTWKQVSCGSTYTAAIKTDGTLWSWGSNSAGQLGDNTQTSARSSPVQTVAGGTNWKQVNCGDSHTAAIKTDGTVWVWGSNGSGRLGDNTVVSTSSPVQTIAGGTNWKQISAGNAHTAAISEDDINL